MSEQNNKIKIYSYNKVWKVKHKVYSFQNIKLPIPVEPMSLLYFGVTALFIIIISAIFPVLKNFSSIVRFLAIPYCMTQFFMKKKLDGKNPIKYFLGYIYYILFERGMYIERFKLMPIKREEKLSLNWYCSNGKQG